MDPIRDGLASTDGRTWHAAFQAYIVIVLGLPQTAMETMSFREIWFCGEAMRMRNRRADSAVTHLTAIIGKWMGMDDSDFEDHMVDPYDYFAYTPEEIRRNTLMVLQAHAAACGNRLEYHPKPQAK